MINLANELREHNLKVTPQRLAITEALYKRGHINIDTLYELMLEKFHTISLATIYKNIHIMAKNSLIQEVKIPQNKSVYELTKEAHSHLVCTKCHMVEDVDVNFDALLNTVKTKGNFKISKADLVISGICSNCI